MPPPHAHACSFEHQAVVVDGIELSTLLAASIVVTVELIAVLAEHHASRNPTVEMVTQEAGKEVAVIASPLSHHVLGHLILASFGRERHEAALNHVDGEKALTTKVST